MKGFFQVCAMSLLWIFLVSAQALGDAFSDAVTDYKRGRYSQAYDFFIELAYKGNAEAQIYVGLMYENGQGVDKDINQAIAWYSKADKNGHALGYSRMYQLLEAHTWDYWGSWVWGGLESSAITKSEVTQDDAALNLEAAENGDADAQFNLGVIYSLGRGVVQDDFQAVDWYKKSAEQGFALSQANLGLMQIMGRGIEQDFNAALKMIIQAATQSADPHIKSLLLLPAQRGFLEIPLALNINGRNRILDRGTYVIFLPEQKRMLHPYEGNFFMDPEIREGDTLSVQVKHDGEYAASATDDSISLKFELKTDFLIKQLLLEGAPIRLSSISPVNDPNLIKTEASVLISPAQLSKGLILTVISRTGRESRLSLTQRDGEFTIATPADMQL